MERTFLPWLLVASALCHPAVAERSNGDPPQWTPGLTSLNGADDDVFALAQFDDGSGPAVYLGGTFVDVGAIEGNFIAKWNGETMEPLGLGLNDTVLALAVFDDGNGPALYAGGFFTTADGTIASHIARWDGSQWQALGPGLNAGVRSMAVYDAGDGPALYVGGEFTHTGDDALPLSRLAKWDGQNWSAVGGGVFGDTQFHLARVSALLVHDDGSGFGSSLFVGGAFLNAGLISARNIARWDGQTWSTVGLSQASFPVSSLEIFNDGTGSALFVGGSFRFIDGLLVNNIAKWDGVQWSPVGEGTDDGVSDLEVFTDDAGEALYIGGAFDLANGKPIARLARYDGVNWSGVGEAGRTRPNRLLAFDDGEQSLLIAARGVQRTGQPNILNIAAWNGAEWRSLVPGFSTWATAIASFDDGSGEALYVSAWYEGEDFFASGVVRWDGVEWSNVGGGLPDRYDPVWEFHAFDDGSGPSLFAGGDFRIDGKQPINYIAKWDGAEWLPVGGGFNGSCYALIDFDDGSGPALYAGGRFRNAGGQSAGRVARWDGQIWSPVGAGIGDSSHWVNDFCIFDDGSGPSLYACGYFDRDGNGDIGLNTVARWDGSEWRPLGEGIPGQLAIAAAMAVFDDGTGPALYVAGTFDEAGGVQVRNIAKWNGQTWSDVGGGVGGQPDRRPPMSDLIVYDDGTGPALYACGRFQEAGGEVDVGVIARWDGTTWTTLEDGLSRTPEDNADPSAKGMAVFDDGYGPALFVTGGFARAGEHISHWFARWGPSRDAGQNADLAEFSVFTGQLVSGGLPELGSSDDAYIHTRSGFGVTFIDLHNMEMRISATTTVQAPATLDLSIESRIDEPAGVAQIGLLNHNTAEFDPVGQYALGSADAIDTIFGIGAANYVNAQGEIELSIKHIVFVPFLAFTFESWMDWVEIVVQ